MQKYPKNTRFTAKRLEKRSLMCYIVYAKSIEYF